MAFKYPAARRDESKVSVKSPAVRFFLSFSAEKRDQEEKDGHMCGGLERQMANEWRGKNKS